MRNKRKKKKEERRDRDREYLEILLEYVVRWWSHGWIGVK